MFKFFRIFCVTALLIFVLSCNSDSEMKVEIQDEKPVQMAKMSVISDVNEANSWTSKGNMSYTENQNSTIPDNKTEKKLIKEGNINFSTNDLKNTRNEVEKLIKQINGYVEEERGNSYDYKVDINLKVRIPVNDFDKFVEGLLKIAGDFDEKNIRVKDVSAEFVDVESRIRTKKEIEKRYIEILSKAKTVSEILEVEAQLGVIREEIESVEERLKFLISQTSYSTLEIYISQLKDTSSESINGFAQSFSEGWSIFISFVLLLVKLWPFAVIIFIILMIVLYFAKKQKRNK